MAAVKDSHIVIRFMALYMRLRDSIDDDPESLLILSMGDDILHSLCSDLHFLAFEIQTAERRTRKLFANPVDPKFVEAWRDYEARYSHVLGVIELADLLGVDVNAICPPQQPGGEIEPRHQFAAEEARKSAATITNIFAFAEQQIEFEREWLDETTSEEVDRGISEWESLERNASFDLEGILRRRMLTPFVLIPRHVSSHHGMKDKLSLLGLLQQAHEAFIFGVPFAAISLLRSILELVLKIHYGSTGSDLKDIINNVSYLPRGIARTNLHKLRRLGNSILHFDKELFRILDAPDNLEPEILMHLYTLRLLIEAAPLGRVERLPPRSKK